MSTFTKVPAELDRQAAGASGSPGFSPTKPAPASAAASPVCMEIPVRLRGVQAGAPAEGAAESAATFAEDTQTLILFPRGAVVRLATQVSLGQQVMLTNLKTGQHVNCKVVSVRPSETARGYVELEFTHRTGDFWGGPSSTVTEEVASPASPLKPPLETKVEEMTAAFKAQVGTKQELSFDTTIQAIPKTAAIKPTRIEDLPVRRTQAAPAATLVSQPRRSAPAAPAPRLYAQPARWHAAGQPRAGRKWLIAGTSVAALMLALAGGAYFFGLRSFSAPAISALTKPIVSKPAPANDAPQVIVVKADDAAPAAQPQANASVATPSGAEGGTAPAASSVASPAPAKVSRVGEALRKAAAKLHLNLGNSKIVAPPARQPVATATNEPPAATADESSAVPGAAASGIAGGTLPAVPAAVPAPTAAPEQAVKVASQPTLPRAIATVRPQYPEEAKAAHIEGDVTIQADVDASGTVGKMKVISGPAVFQRAALDALRQWKYEPARLDGQPVAGHIFVTLRFRLH